jgi:hypothetical protein
LEEGESRRIGEEYSGRRSLLGPDGGWRCSGEATSAGLAEVDEVVREKAETDEPPQHQSDPRISTGRRDSLPVLSTC